jgi:hypothetical protein
MSDTLCMDTEKNMNKLAQLAALEAQRNEMIQAARAAAARGDAVAHRSLLSTVDQLTANILAL